MTEFTIPGPPVSKQRPRYNSKTGHFYTPKKTTDYEDQVAYEAMAAGVRLEPKKKYKLEIDFYLSSFSRDRDNLIKSVQDGLVKMGDGWDDNQVWNLVVNTVPVRDGSEEKAVVRVSEIESTL